MTQQPMVLTPDQVNRYSRHIIMGDVGSKGQRNLLGAKALIVGAGGLGSPSAIYLALAGVGTIGIVDFDVVEISNLQRQILHHTSDIGRPKLDSARDNIISYNPDTNVVLHEVRLESHNAREIISQYDLVINGADNFATRYLVNDACYLEGKPLVDGSILIFDGQATLFLPGQGCYRCLFPEPPPPGEVPSCAEAGVLGMLPGLVGTIQATETVKLILDVGTSLASRLLLIDALDMEFRTVKLRRNPACPLCGDEPTVTELIDYEQFCAGASAEASANTVLEISPADFVSQRDSGWSPFLLDVRTSAEEQIVTLPGTDLRVSHLNILIEQHSLPKDRDIVVYCRTGGRSEAVASALSRVGFDSARLFNLAGGIHAWSDQVDSAVPKY